MSTPFAIALVAGLISFCSADAAFELDALEIWLPFAGPDGAAGNPAAATALPCPRWTLQYHLPFGLHELRYNSLSMTLPQGKFRLNAGLASTGFSLHRERSAWEAALRWAPTWNWEPPLPSSTCSKKSGPKGIAPSAWASD